MKLRYISDLHLEFFTSRKLDRFLKTFPSGFDDICILAGDIGNPSHKSGNYEKFMNYMSCNFKKTFVIAGNHEYYCKKKLMSEINENLISFFNKFDNISYLDNDYEIYNGICFIGSTLWSKVSDPHYMINDVYNIQNLTCEKYNNMNDQCVNYLENVLKHHKNCIVITHHMPSYTLIDEKYKTSHLMPYNQWFANNLDEIIKRNENNIKCWIYGHTHTPNKTFINNIPFICNPMGYPGENNKIDFEAFIVI